MIIDENVFPSSIRPQRCSHMSVKSGAAFSIYLKTTVLFYGGFIFLGANSTLISVSFKESNTKYTRVNQII